MHPGPRGDHNSGVRQYGSFAGALDLLASETIDADQDNRLADGTEMVVGVLGMLRGEKPKH